MAGTIYNSTYATGITLNNPATQNPATIGSSGTISNYKTSNGGHALYGVVGTAWTVFNYGTVAGFSTAPVALYLATGGSVTNGSTSARSADVFGTTTGISIKNGSGTVTNFGTLFSASSGTVGSAVDLNQGGTLTNEANGFILGAHTGVSVEAKPGTITNFGAIQSSSTSTGGSGIYLGAGGQVTNQSSGVVLAYNSAIAGVGGPVTITNYGTVSNTGTTGPAVFVNAGGTVTNESGGTITSGKNAAILAPVAATLVNDGGIASNGGKFGAVYFAGGGNIINAGTIALSVAGAALEMSAAGSIRNTGLVSALSGTGLLVGSTVLATAATVSVTNDGTIYGLVGAAVSGLDNGKSTIVNYGTITGGNGVAVAFGGGADTLVIEPKSVLNGTVANFSPGDTIDFAGESGSAATFSNGVLGLTSGGKVIATVTLSGAFGAADFSVTSDGAGGTDVKTAAAALPNDVSGDGVSDALMSNTNNGGLVVGELSQGAMAYTQIGALGPEWQFAGTGDLLGDGRDVFLIWAGNSAASDYGALVVGEDVGGTATYTQIGSIGPEWKFEGVGPLEGGANDDFLLWNGGSADGSFGALVVGAVDDLSARYTQIGSIGPEWQFEGIGNYVGNGSSEFLVWDTSSSSAAYGALELGQDINGTAQYTTVGGLDPAAWVFEGTGDLLNDGKSSFLLWNQSSGALWVGEVDNGAAQYTQIAAVGPEWQFLGVGNYDGNSPAEFLMRDSINGALVLATVASSHTTYAVVGNVGPEWNFHNSQPALVV